MELTHTQSELLDPKVATLIEAGFLTPDLKITDDLTYFLRHLTFMANMDAVIARAKEIVKEKKAKTEVK